MRLGYVLEEEANSEMRMKLEGSGVWGVTGNESSSGLKDHLYLPLDTYNLY